MRRVRNIRLKPVLIHDKGCLDVSTIAEELGELTRIRPWTSTLTILFDWFSIIGALLIAVTSNSILVYIFCGLIVGVKQHAVAVMLHEGAHLRLFSNRRFNDIFTNLLLGYPLGTSAELYRYTHRLHHYNLNTDSDPDLRFVTEQLHWHFPKTRRELLLLLLKQTCGGAAIELFKYQAQVLSKYLSSMPNRGQQLKALLPGLAYYALVAVLLSATGRWSDFLFLWVVPLFFVFGLLHWVRTVSEHSGLLRLNDLQHTRNFHGPWLERLFLAPHNIGYHLVHHLFPSIPFYNLPKANALLKTLPNWESAHENSCILGFHPNSVLHDVSIPPPCSYITGEAEGT